MWLALQGLDVNAKDYSKRTVLHYAAQSGSVELVQWLVTLGLDINAFDYSPLTGEMTALHYAAIKGLSLIHI